MGSTSWHALELEAVGTRLETDLELGLTSADAEKRLAEQGPNDLGESERRSKWPMLIAQFTGSLTIILLLAVIISASIGEILDAVVIGAIVVLNGVLGFVQEWRADKEIEALQAMLVPHARVHRDGKVSEVDARTLVAGDVVDFEAGDRVPADLRLATTTGLMIDESALTGESVAVRKTIDTVAADAPLAERTCLAFSGTDVAAGRGRGLVVETGTRTEFGTVADLTAQAEMVDLPLQQSLASLSKKLGAAAVVIAAVTVLIGAVAGRPFEEMFLTGVSLAVAVVPEGLPAVVTVTLALGMRSMSKRKALLRNLEAAETLGAASVICTDKTGTLTENRMSVRRVWTAGVDGQGDHHGGKDLAGNGVVDALIETAQQCNHAVLIADESGIHALGDPTEAALLMLATERGAPEPAGDRVREIPFDSDAKVMTVVERAVDGGLRAHVKGAPEVVISRADRILTAAGEVPLDDRRRSSILSAQQEMASAGLRTMAFANLELDAVDGDIHQGLVFLGLVGMHDPPRPEVPEAVETAMSAGVDVVVMTGDAGATALAIAQEIGLPAQEVLTGPEIDHLSADELTPLLDGTRVLARTTPAHKMLVVKSLQAEGAVVAVTGDGVNDAPALKQASIGVAMGERGTDVARASADVVLADDNFASIVAAIEEGRRQFANIRKFIRYLLSSNLGEVIAISGSVALGWPLVLLPVQILWINLMTDGVTALALGVEPVEPDAMKRPPRRVEDSVVGRVGLWWIVGGGTVIGLITLAVFRLTLGTGDGDDLVRAQTMAFTAMVLLETVNVFNFRAERQSLAAVGIASNPWLLVAAAGAVVAQVAAVHLPILSSALGTTALGLDDWIVLSVVALPILALGELVKWRLRS